MKTIKLQGINELKAKEKLPEVPELVKQYLDTKELKDAGKYFRVTINQKSDPKSGAGIAYSNELVIEKKAGDEWIRQYSTGMRQYRGAYNYETDNWDISLNDPAILTETKEEVIYAVRTGTGNIKVYCFKKTAPALLFSFNVNDHKKTQERIELLQKLIDDASAFIAYVKNDLGHRWYITDNAAIDDGNVVVLLVDHADRDYDAISDCYRIYIWVKGKGFSVSQTHQTGLRHPGGKFYRIGIRFSVAIANQGVAGIDLVIEVRNRSQEWNANHEIRVEWEVAENIKP